MTDNEIEWGQVPAECTLPTAERPLRVMEFDEVLAAVRTVDRPEPTLVVLGLDAAPGRAEAVEDLARRETACCSFFGLAVHEQDGMLVLKVSVPPERVDVLDAIAGRAADVGGRS